MEQQRQRKDNEGSRNSKFLQGRPGRRSFIIVLIPRSFPAGLNFSRTEIQDIYVEM